MDALMEAASLRTSMQRWTYLHEASQRAAAWSLVASAAGRPSESREADEASDVLSGARMYETARDLVNFERGLTR
jgi:hypothetical protein